MGLIDSIFIRLNEINSEFEMVVIIDLTFVDNYFSNQRNRDDRY